MAALQRSFMVVIYAAAVSKQGNQVGVNVKTSL